MVKQEVFWFHISMNYSELVQVLNPRDYLLEELARLAFLQLLVLNDVVE